MTTLKTSSTNYSAPRHPTSPSSLPPTVMSSTIWTSLSTTPYLRYSTPQILPRSSLQTSPPTASADQHPHTEPSVLAALIPTLSTTTTQPFNPACILPPTNDPSPSAATQTPIPPSYYQTTHHKATSAAAHSATTTPIASLRRPTRRSYAYKLHAHDLRPWRTRGAQARTPDMHGAQVRVQGPLAGRLSMPSRSGPGVRVSAHQLARS